MFNCNSSSKILCWLAIIGVSFSASQHHAGMEHIQSSTSSSWRCGIFLMPGPYDLTSSAPRQVWTFPTVFKASCAAPAPVAYNRTCYNLMDFSLSRWSYSHPSKVAPSTSGLTIGDDFCSIINVDEFQGRQVGFFYNYCGLRDWVDTGLRRKEKVCCRAGRYYPCTGFPRYG